MSVRSTLTLPQAVTPAPSAAPSKGPIPRLSFSTRRRGVVLLITVSFAPGSGGLLYEVRTEPQNKRVAAALERMLASKASPEELSSLSLAETIRTVVWPLMGDQDNLR